MTLEQRLERLERQNAWMKGLNVVALAMVASVLLVAQAKNESLPDLEVSSLTVKSRSGKELAFLGPDKRDVSLRFRNGNNLAFFGMSDGVPHVYCGDSVSHGHIAFGVNRQGSPVFGVRDKNGVNRAHFVVAPDGRVDVQLNDARPKTSEGGECGARVLFSGHGGTCFGDP